MESEAEEKAIELIKKFSGKENAKNCVEEILAELKQSFNLSMELGLHPHAEGLIAGGLVFWNKVKNELENI